MSKTWKMPTIIALGNGGDAGVIGGGTGQGGADLPDATPCNYSFWLEHYKVDLDDDGQIDEYDFYAWWIGNEFTYDDWMKFAPEYAELWDEEP